jgi:hypothetical protein
MTLNTHEEGEGTRDIGCWLETESGHKREGGVLLEDLWEFDTLDMAFRNGKAERFTFW